MSQILSRGLPLMAFEGLFNVALQGAWQTTKLGGKIIANSGKSGLHKVPAGFINGAANSTLRYAGAVDRAGGQVADVMLRDVTMEGFKKGNAASRTKDILHAGYATGVPVLAGFAGIQAGEHGAARDIALGQVQLTQFADSISMGGTPNLGEAKKSRLNEIGGQKIANALAMQRQQRASEEMYGDLPLAMSSIARGGGLS